MTERIAIYAGSFDPLTNGHLDVLKASLAVADTIYAAIGIQSRQDSRCSRFEERVELIESGAAAEFGKDAKRIKVVAFDGLVIDAAQQARRLDHDPRPARRHRSRLRDADGRHERDHGAGPADRVSAGEPVGAHHYRHIGAPDRLDGRRHPPLRAGGGRERAASEIQIKT